MNRTDEEEIELLKRVWSEYGKPAVYGVAITMAVIFGYKAYQKHQHETASAASCPVSESAGNHSGRPDG
ncbi:tetratricopeptide repeat protein [Endozoicomonas lisbonensis]|uniref:tetratricopeptide repeat protein n=1 Tax=Endozoicomonas lisbonensis TaxID=3120522 RepID=UPI003393E1C6